MAPAAMASKAKSPTGAVVRPIVDRLLTDNERLSADEVYDLVHDKLTVEGYDAKGLRLRVTEALASDAVDEVEPGVFSAARREAGA